MSAQEQGWLRHLEVLEPLRGLFAGNSTWLAVQLSSNEPELFELGHNYVRIGVNWLNDSLQSRRALIMGLLRTRYPDNFGDQFQLEVITDFLLLTIFDDDQWRSESGEMYSLKRDMKFATVAPSFQQYCKSPFRSLSHSESCAVIDSESKDLPANIWGIRPLLSVSLWRVYTKLSLSEQLKMMQAIQKGALLPQAKTLHSTSADELVLWFNSTLNDYLLALTGSSQSEAVHSTLKELEVETPTRWELTMDLTNTPVWREILAQMRERSQFFKERVLVFTPEGATAFPSGLPVAWNAEEIRSQKHVMIACEWPRPQETVHIQARHLYAQQSCDKITRPFWD